MWSLSPPLGFQQYCHSISLSSLWSLTTSFGCLSCFVEACFLGCKMALSAVSVKDLALFWRKDWQKRQMSISPKHSKWKEWVHPSKTLRSLSLLTKKPGISHLLFEFGWFCEAYSKGSTSWQVSLSVLCHRHLANHIFFPDPVNQTLLGNFVMLENRLQAVQHNVISNC